MAVKWTAQKYQGAHCQVPGRHRGANPASFPSNQVGRGLSEKSLAFEVGPVENRAAQLLRELLYQKSHGSSLTVNLAQTHAQKLAPDGSTVESFESVGVSVVGLGLLKT